METIEATFTLDRETKGAAKYSEVDVDSNVIPMQGASIGTLYVRKSAFKGQPIPKKVVVRVTPT